MGGETVWMKTNEDMRNNYIPRMEWAASSDEIVMQYMNRLQNQNQVLLGNIKTGEVREVFIDKDEAWVNVVNDFLWIDDGESRIEGRIDVGVLNTMIESLYAQLMHCRSI